MQRFHGRVAVVTGAASGIGRAVAYQLADKGCDLVICDLDDQGLAETKAGVEERERRATSYRVDVSDKEAMRRFAADVEKEVGDVHILVNNAGVTVAKSVKDHSIEDYEWLLGINLFGVIYGCKLFLPLMERVDEAHIVNLSSVFGIVGPPHQSSYAASKFAVRGFTESLRAELADTHIGVTSVHPGGISTNIIRNARSADERKLMKDLEALYDDDKRMMSADDAAALIVRGIEKNSPRVLVTREAYIFDVVARTSPALGGRLVARVYRRMKRDGLVG